uniref:von Willebrand factor type A domain containing protein n=1 Tax=Haliotis discus discus TaxID=91233 RepID=G8Z4Y9_HALDI|nr:von Willebrand factor type A domain containing protein [Haliotis discus discus]
MAKLDLAFVMDCTGSMGKYIDSARENIRNIIDQISSDGTRSVKFALVEYRDHPPQDETFVTREHDFISDISRMRSWLDDCSAVGGGDGPEAVVDGLQKLLTFSWRKDATRIAVLIADAPPHGLGIEKDAFPLGCPDKYDPFTAANALATQEITLYVAGCEPSISPYKDFFTGISYITGGQYVPLASANNLAVAIVFGAEEEMSLEHVMKTEVAKVMEHMDMSGRVQKNRSN